MESVCCLIACLLKSCLDYPPHEDAIRTGTLSKRWQHLWASVPTLIFTHSDYKCLRNYGSRLDFPLLVDKTLAQCRQLKLKKFQMHTYYKIRFESQFRNWIRLAISCNVEELDFDLDFVGSKPEFLLDQPIFINSYFTDLRLGGCKLNPSGAINWENLRSLCLSWVNLDQNLIVNIFSGSPLLETLVLEYCTWPNIKGISNAPTSSLSLTQYRQLKHLKKFKVYISYFIQFQSQLNNLILYAIRCNVKELDLGFWDIGPGCKFFMLDQGFFTGACVTKLRLCGCVLNPVGAISWKSLRSLYISNYWSLDEDLIENILSGSPVLETLVLDDCYGYRRLNITSYTVKNLMLFGFNVNDYRGSEADIIEINAPNILSLTIESHMVAQKFLLVNVSSLVKANLDYTGTWDLLF